MKLRNRQFGISDLIKLTVAVAVVLGLWRVGLSLLASVMFSFVLVYIPGRAILEDDWFDRIFRIR